MKRLWRPKTLFGRNLLLIVALVALAELSILLLFRQWIQEPRMLAMQQFAFAEANAQRSLLQGLDAAGRAHWQRTLGAPRVPQAGQPEMLRAQQFMRVLKAQLHGAMGDEVDLRWHEAGAPSQVGLWLGLRIGQQWYWRKLDHSGIPGNLPPFMLSVSLASGLMALLVAALISRRINQPLQQLAQAAGALGRGQALELPANLAAMPQEIAQLARSMQQVAHDLEASGHERALMLAGVSHDLRTPLTKLRLAVEILASGAVGPDDAALLQGMVAHIGAANAVIEQFVAFARAGSDEAEQEIAMHGMNEVGELMHSLLQQLAPAERACVVLTLPDGAEGGEGVDDEEGTLHLRCRPVALRRALANLLENALRYAGDGNGNGDGNRNRASIEFAALHQPGKLVFEVRDRGPGIPPSELARICQPFARLDRDSGRPGSGLGLAIVERIAQLHHGSLQLLPRAGGGLVARLVLRLTA